jgi:PAS domain S-box-containing protein
LKLTTVLFLAAVAVSGAQPSKRPLTAAIAVHHLSRSDAAKALPALLRGTVTAVMPEWGGFALQDATDGLYVSAAQMNPRPNLQVGQRVELSGQSHPGNFAPIVVAESVRVLGTGPLPEPIRARWRYISSGACDNSYVQVEGVVRSVAAMGPRAWSWPATALHIDVGGNLLWAYVRKSSNFDPALLPDATVRVDGVCIVFSNSRRQFEENVLLVSRASEIKVTQPAVSDPFSAPVTTIDHLFQYRPGATVQHRVKIRGVVTAVEEGRVFLQSRENGILVNAVAPPTVKVGDEAEAVGFPAPGPYSAVLSDALVRGTGARAHPVPLRIAVANLENTTRETNAFPDAVLIETDANLLDLSRSAQEQTLTLQDGSTVFTARLKGRPRTERLPRLVNGDRLRLIGVCTFQRGSLGTERSFEILMRSPADLRVVKGAPWLNREVAVRAAGLLLALLAVGAIWLALLRRRVAAQTRTIRRQIEREALLEKRFRDLVENATDMVYIRDLTGRLLLVNGGTETLTGYRREELMGMNVVDLLAPEERVRARRQIADRLSGQPPDFQTAEWRFLRKDGREVTVEVKQRFFAEEEGGIRVEVIGRDVTARARALVDNQERFRTLADNIAQLAWMADERGFIFWFNQRWFDYTGSSLEECAGNGWRRHLHPEHIDRVSTGLQHSIETGEIWEETFPLLGRDGEYRWFLSKAMPIRDPQGRVLRWFGTSTDVTEQKQLESDLQRSNRDLQQFAYVASHDLQEPLRNVCAFAQLLARTYDEQELTRKRRDYIDIITSGAKRMEALVTDLLAYSRMTGVEKLGRRPIDFESVLNKMLQHLSASLTESGGVVTHDFLPTIEANESQISQVVQNLLGNSIKYRRLDVPLRIHVSANREGDHWLFAFRDNGVGFEPQYADNVFGIFKRLQNHTVPGTGIGLAICKTIIERHGGRIWADARPGEGATFYFTIPGAPQREERTPELPAMSQAGFERR